MCWWWEKC